MPLLGRYCEDNFHMYNAVFVILIWTYKFLYELIDLRYVLAFAHAITCLSGQLNWFRQFLCERLSPFNPKGIYYSCMVLQFMWRKDFLLQELISRKLCRFLQMFLTGFSSVSILLLFPLLITAFLFLLDFLFISSNIDEVLLISQSVNMFVFGDLNVHHKDWLTYSGGTDRPGELCYISQMTLLRWSTLLLRSQTVTLIFGFISFFVMLVFVLQLLLLLWVILVMLLSQFWLTFCQIHNWMPCFIVHYAISLWLILCWLRWFL